MSSVESLLKLFAATLEVLIVDLTPSHSFGHRFRWIRFAGDGFCRLISKEAFTALNPEGLSVKSSLATAAMPFANERLSPRVEKRGLLAKGQLLALGTDGLIDQFSHEGQSLPVALRKLAKSGITPAVFRDLLRLRIPHTSDDRTLVVLCNRS